MAGAQRDFEFSACTAWASRSVRDRGGNERRRGFEIYAPVGPHRDLLAYLVRRLIENGDQPLFVARAADTETTESALVADPYEALGAPIVRAIRVFRCRARDLLAATRNSKGVEYGDRTALAAPGRETRRAGSAA